MAKRKVHARKTVAPKKGSLLGAYLRLFRIEHALLLAFAVLMAELLVSRAYTIPLPTVEIILLSLLVPIFIEMGSFALNDYLDIATDRENRRNDRPLARGEIPPRQALAIAAVFYVLGIGAAIPLPTMAFAIAVVFAFLSVIYNYGLKDVPLLGNIYIGASMAIPFLFGNIVVFGKYYTPLFGIAGVAMVAGIGREILKSAEDIEGDIKHRHAYTLPAVIGIRNASYLASLCYLILAPLSALPFVYGLSGNLLSFGLVGVAALAFVYMAYSSATNPGKENLTRLRKASLLALGIGLAGFAASLI